MSRWVRVSADIFEHELFAQSELSEREAWLWLVAKAAWKDTRHRIGSEVVPVPRGSMFCTLRELRDEWRWKSDFRVRSFLEMLEREAMIERSANAGKTHLTICNYDRYQNPSDDSQRKENAAETQGKRKENALKIPVYQDTKEEVGVGSAQERDESHALETRKAICKIYEAAGSLPPDTGRVVIWLERGYSHSEIVATVSGSVRPGKTPPLAYFDQPLERMRLIPNAPARQENSTPNQRPPPARERRGSAALFDALDRIYPDEPDSKTIPASPILRLADSR